RPTRRQANRLHHARDESFVRPAAFRSSGAMPALAACPQGRSLATPRRAIFRTLQRPALQADNQRLSRIKLAARAQLGTRRTASAGASGARRDELLQAPRRAGVPDADRSAGVIARGL